MVLDVGGGLVEVNEWIGWCWTLGLVEVWWKIQ